MLWVQLGLWCLWAPVPTNNSPGGHFLGPSRTNYSLAFIISNLQKSSLARN